MKNYRLNETDSRFLEALLLATGGEGGAPLQEVLLMADAVDGTVFELKEVEDALLKLVAAKVVTITKNKLNINPDFLCHYEALTLQEGLSESDELLLNLLQEQTIAEETIKAVKSGELKKYKLKTYYQQYQEQFGG
ncbi:hypothetical protein [Pontibacter fetidus]|uniref:Uncharacterized protein n=1 Tax=Pontibacter fetidus TaxID=2700082 RepID=A0A6B2H5X3_9BACT|nr:hypothetical protein [Pontibacter fetidus]NDK55220.1 hypothetical protein [Pontibacter fetidus]